MKYLITLLALGSSLSTWANYHKPDLLALFFSTRNYNISQDSFCYLGTPTVFEGKTVLNCIRDDQHELVMWEEDGIGKSLFSSSNFVSVPQYLAGTLSWYEYDMEGVKKVYQWKKGSITELPVDIHSRSVTYLGDSWIYQSRESLKVLQEGVFHTAQIDDIAYVFSPGVSRTGEFAVKVRRKSLANSSPDEIWSFQDNKWIKVFSDKDSDPQSPWLSFNNTVAIGDGKVFVIAKDQEGEAIVEVSGHQQRVLAREGVDVKKFESFSIAYNGGSLVFRAIDHQNRKVLYVHDGVKLSRLLTQGDVVLTPWGITSEVNYSNPDSIIYNNPGIGENGDVVIQATLVDFDDKKTLLGVGVISIKKDNL